MRGFRHHSPLPNEVETSRFSKQSSDARSKQDIARNMRKAAKEKRDRLNSEKRTRRAKEKVGELEGKVEVLEGKVEVLEMAAETSSDKVEALARQNAELKQEVKCLTARFKSRVRREPQKIETAVKRALSSVFVTQQTVYRVKTPDGVIQNWARNVILHLVCASDVPAANTWAAFSCIAEGLGISVEGSWSARSAGRVVLEGALAAEEMIVEDFAQALGKSVSLA